VVLVLLLVLVWSNELMFFELLTFTFFSIIFYYDETGSLLVSIVLFGRLSFYEIINEKQN
jgi:hypothetical protein